MGADPAQQLEQRQVEQQQSALKAFGADLKLFEDSDIGALWRNRYRTARSLQDATREGLERAELPPGIIDHIMKLNGGGAGRVAAGMGTAVGPGSASMAASGAPAPGRLVDSAAKLHLLTDNGIWKLLYSNSELPYVDTAGVIDQIHYWAELAMTAAVEEFRPNAPSPLLVSGLIKTGKSYTLGHVVPAVVAEVLRKQGEKSPLAGMMVLRLRGDQLLRQAGATVMLWSLLGELLRWAHEERVPMQEGVLEAARDALHNAEVGGYLNSPLCCTPGRAIFSFLKAVQVPVLVLWDEVQSLFLPTIAGKLDTIGAEYIRDTFMKDLLVYGPQTMLWCLTGSSMAQTWISLAKMPPNGYAVLTTVRAVNLPTTYSTGHMRLAWELLQGSSPQVLLDSKLLELCPPSIALLTVLVRSWTGDGCPKDVAAFIQEFMRTKLIDESLKEWKLGLEGMSLSQRIAVLDLSFPGVGADIETDLHTGLRRFLAPHLDRTVDGRYYFRDAYQRQIVRLLINNDGTLRESWSGLKFSATLTQLDAGWNLLRLGETADYLLGPSASRRWKQNKRPVGMDEFTTKLEAIANEVATKLASEPGGAGLDPQELWDRQPWFQEVLNSEWNDRDRKAYMQNKKARGTHLDMLVFYLRLSRNVLGHTKPWEWPYGVTVNVDMIQALPSVLGQSLFNFNEVMVGALRVLSSQTMKDAAAECEAQLSGADGGIEDKGGSGSGLSGGTGSSSSGGGLRSGAGSSHSSRGLCSGAGSSHSSGASSRDDWRGSSSVRGWGQGALRTATFAPHLGVQHFLFAPSAAVGLRQPPVCAPAPEYGFGSGGSMHFPVAAAAKPPPPPDGTGTAAAPPAAAAPPTTAASTLYMDPCAPPGPIMTSVSVLRRTTVRGGSLPRQDPHACGVTVDSGSPPTHLYPPLPPLPPYAPVLKRDWSRASTGALQLAPWPAAGDPWVGPVALRAPPPDALSTWLLPLRFEGSAAPPAMVVDNSLPLMGLYNVKVAAAVCPCGPCECPPPPAPPPPPPYPSLTRWIRFLRSSSMARTIWATLPRT